MFKTILWKEVWTGKKTFGRIAGFVVVLAISLFNFKTNQSLFQELLNVAYGIYLVTFFKSKNVYCNIDSLISLPITVRELCISRTLCNGIKLLIWEVINVILLLTGCGKCWSAMISSEMVFGIIVYHIIMVQVTFMSECLLVILGKKFIYPVFALASIVLILAQILLSSEGWVFNFCMQCIVLGATFCLYKKLSKVENEKIYERWN